MHLIEYALTVCARMQHTDTLTLLWRESLLLVWQQGVCTMAHMLRPRVKH